MAKQNRAHDKGPRTRGGTQKERRPAQTRACQGWGRCGRRAWARHVWPHRQGRMEIQGLQQVLRILAAARGLTAEEEGVEAYAHSGLPDTTAGPWRVSSRARRTAESRRNAPVHCRRRPGYRDVNRNDAATRCAAGADPGKSSDTGSQACINASLHRQRNTIPVGGSSQQ
jgi:hypothetical protein